ncbi:ribosome biogenesis GTPase YlqF [Cyanobacterium aponinum AL20118]|uniref:Ribosome biogenesis GTPase A n=3 Tax=Cyanobacterium aponinum TaxID=379064 RepID=K9Z305_CYAAP|nr:ribosome biogenesis GTPase YlqF [Cyanobacterium aponinum]AFZ53591.1 Ras superfamily GTP-binding protein YlqF [Cyanobacterium aponinum PCC 10605]MBD2394883.1 ribosome biogenesis GTPase YlqF [Cyanobacterium aponinum FACHB-4101]MTF38405.1 ribosome biogenesis GTPase YlqF [Cyanobacterium aponinum 0216]PHV61806.1 ribosome biogenesis GTPase YlqF [Cyanobacterium aponinum IPPAS B-1201]WPF89734.1 ribosome biogenesis GTPase YlqF [Cyanobacterium aponinum AL20115]
MAIIQWYPGHISKAERQLKEQLKRVDVVLEVRDARIPLASHHPQLKQWIGDKPRLLVLNREDMISDSLRKEWQEWFGAQGEIPFFTNAKDGKGVKAVKKASQSMEKQVNERRRSRGMLPRPVRAVVIGFPNVGKSALINRLLQRKIVASARKAGVTKQLQWVRISDQLELLDAPGVIPWKLENQEDALKLAICEDIGEAAYDNQLVAADFVDLLVKLGSDEVLKSRYGLDPLEMTGEEFIYELAARKYKNDKERVARQLLQDFRKGYLGSVSLEYPPVME